MYPAFRKRIDARISSREIEIFLAENAPDFYPLECRHSQ